MSEFPALNGTIDAVAFGLEQYNDSMSFPEIKAFGLLCDIQPLVPEDHHGKGIKDFGLLCYI